MLGFNSQQRFLVYRESVDMRKGVYGLCGLVNNELGLNPNDGTVYVFFSKTYQTVRILVWDRDGYVVYSKWLARGRFENFQHIIQGKSGELSYQYLVMILSGISLVGVKKKLRYEMKITATKAI